MKPYDNRGLEVSYAVVPQNRLEISLKVDLRGIHEAGLIYGNENVSGMLNINKLHGRDVRWARGLFQFEQYNNNNYYYY